jgi:SAM-dependent methyltransferase
MIDSRLPIGIGPAPDPEPFTDLVEASCARVPIVLDAGFGDGRLRPRIIQASCRWIGIDIDPARVAIGRQHGWPVLEADLTSTLPLRTSSVDGVMVVCVLNTVAEGSLRARAVAEVGRVLRPGGVVWVRDFVRLPVPDRRVGAAVRTQDWLAMRRRYALGVELASWVSGQPRESLAAGAFPAFDIAAGAADDPVFRSHRYSEDQFRVAVQSGQIRVPFLACHPTEAELTAEWNALGEITMIRHGTALSRSKITLPVLDVLARKK